MFATHYLEEADANADRAVLMAHGKVVADGPTTEIRARVGTRTIRATPPGVPTDELSALAGVNSAERHGDAVILICSDSDRAIRDLLELYPAARDIEITGAGLEDAFVQLTGDADSEAPVPRHARLPARYRAVSAVLLAGPSRADLTPRPWLGRDGMGRCPEMDSRTGGARGLRVRADTGRV
ncbi:MAG: hypothetical protein WBP81_10285 [Solirubrobacteraceae bacterium]